MATEKVQSISCHCCVVVLVPCQNSEVLRMGAVNFIKHCMPQRVAHIMSGPPVSGWISLIVTVVETTCFSFNLVTSFKN